MTVYPSRKCLSANGLHLWVSSIDTIFKEKLTIILYLQGQFLLRQSLSCRHTPCTQGSQWTIHLPDLSQLLGLQMPNGKPGFMRCRGPCTGRRCTRGRHSRGYAKNPFQVCCIQKKTSLKKNSQECKRACLFSYLLRNQQLGMETKLRFPKSKKSQYMNLKIQWDSRTL